MYIMVISYSSDMTAPDKSPTTEHEKRIADARNGLADVINLARYRNEPTFLTNRGKRVAAVVSIEFYERAKRALDEAGPTP